MTQTYDVLGIGNAIVDTLIRADNSVIEQLGVAKNSMTIIDQKRATELDHFFHNECDEKTIYEIKDMSGGAAANVIAGLSSFGANTAYIGKVGNDAYGQRFTEKLHSRGVTFETAPSDSNLGTAHSYILIGSDGFRTMLTYLGAAGEITERDIDMELIHNSKVTYVTGFLFDCPEARDAIFKAIDMIHTDHHKLAFALSNAASIKRHQFEFMQFIRESADIIFANRDELTALFNGCSLDEAVNSTKDLLKDSDKVVALTCGEDGAMVITSKGVTQVPTQNTKAIVDRTGVGSLFVSGFLYGQTHGLDYQQSADLGNKAAFQGLKNLGARPLFTLSELLETQKVSV